MDWVVVGVSHVFCGVSVTVRSENVGGRGGRRGSATGSVDEIINIKGFHVNCVNNCIVLYCICNNSNESIRPPSSRR